MTTQSPATETRRRTPRKTTAARALVGAMALRDGATTNQAFRLAGYKLAREVRGIDSRRYIMRNGRVLFVYRFVREANDWLFRVGRKVSALGVL